MTSQSCKLYGETICKDVFSLSYRRNRFRMYNHFVTHAHYIRHTNEYRRTFAKKLHPVSSKKKKYATYLSCLPMTIYQCKYSLNMFILAFKIFANSPIFLYKEVIIKSSTMLIFPRKYYLHKNCVKSIRGKKGFVCCDNTEMRLSE